MPICRFFAFACVFVGGCTLPNPPPVDPGALPAIVVNLHNGSQAEAEGYARQYCAEYGGWVDLEKVNGDLREAQLTYSCN